jgi:hypothetical protein
VYLYIKSRQKAEGTEVGRREKGEGSREYGEGKTMRLGDGETRR